MDTYFAPAERASEDKLKGEIAIVTHNPVIQELLHCINGLFVVLDEHRQIIALNDTFLREMGIDDPEGVLGLRLGKVLGCTHCEEEPNGCGTTKYCSSCGAAIAIATTLAENKPAERICALTANRGDAVVDFSLLVKASPLMLGGKRFLLLFLQDVTLEELRASLERTFFHDMSNMLTGLVGVSQLLATDQNNPKLVEVIQQSALRMYKEIEIQKCLFKNDITDFRTTRDEVTAGQLLNELENVFRKHTVSADKSLVLPESLPALSIRTDISLALRVMCNMVSNALEATEVDGTVKVWFEQDGNSLVFSVWNDMTIPEKIRYRIFQRSFTTKEGPGRGIGTYSMQLIGEKLLGGKVGFSSSETEGTIFRFVMPSMPNERHHPLP